MKDVAKSLQKLYEEMSDYNNSEKSNMILIRGDGKFFTSGGQEIVPYELLVDIERKRNYTNHFQRKLLEVINKVNSL